MIHAWRLLSRCGFVWLIGLWGGEMNGWAQDKGMRVVGPEDAMIGYSDCVHLELVASPLDGAAKVARFDRVLDIPGKGYRWDNPGARVRFRTDATNVKARLYFNELHTSTSARNSLGL